MKSRFLALLLVTGTSLLLAGEAEELRPSQCARPLSEAAAIAICQKLDRNASVEEILFHLNKHFADFPAELDGKRVPLPTALVARGDTSLMLLLGAYVRGIQDAMAPQVIPMLQAFVSREFNIVGAGIERFTEVVCTRLERASNDPEIFLRFVTMELQGSLGVPLKWSDLFLRMPSVRRVAPELLNINHPLFPDRPFGFARAQQIMAAQAVYGNSSTQPGDRILEIGYGSPSVLIALGAVIPGQTLTGVDTQPIPKGANEALGKLGIQLMQGNIPTDKEALRKVKERGPYTVIYANDAIFPITGQGAQFDPKVPPREYVRMLYDLAADSGYVILTNDFARSPNFTQEEAVSAGFKIVRWGVPRFLPQEAIAPIRANEQVTDPNLGEIRLFVLRKGEVDAGKIRIEAHRRN